MSAGMEIVWEAVDRAAWRDWMSRVGRSSLLQSWEYGTARAVVAGWRVRRGAVMNGGAPIALMQGLERSAGPAAVLRINRGPVFSSAATETEIAGAFESLAMSWAPSRAKILSIAPELPLTGRSLLLMSRQGYRQRSATAMQSVWMDLRQAEDRLRAGLDGKWRNMLVAAEKSGLVLDVTTDDAVFGWLMDRYRETMVEKGFSGPPVELLLALRRESAGGQPLSILRAMKDGAPVGAVLLAPHGKAATYLIGWNGPEGRSLRANQFLLWNAVMHLKQGGFDWFDLGGIDEEGTPTITAFKLGMGGERYELVGEYVSW